MKRAIISLVVATGILLGTAGPALAEAPGPAPDTEECRPGADNDIVGPWVIMTQAEYEAMLMADRGVSANDPLPPPLVRPGGDDGLIDTWGELTHAVATATWEFCDKNDDGLTCVMKQTAPTDAAPWVQSYLINDNHPFPG